LVATTKTTGASARSRRAGSRKAGTSRAAPLLTYAYCIVEGRTAPRIAGVKGVPDAAPARAVRLGGSRWLVLADVPRRRFDEAALAAGLRDLDWMAACALAHDALIMEVMKSGPVVPMRIFTIFEDEARAVAQAGAAAVRIGKTLGRVAGHAEYGVRIGVTPAARRVRTQAGTAVGRRPITGRSFLEQKRDQLAARRQPAGPTPEERQRILTRLSRLASETRERPVPEGGSSVWLDGAYLVPLAGAAAFRGEVERLAIELRAEGQEVVLTGPWPPYSFLDEHAGES
jgi:hypothetical protein